MRTQKLAGNATSLERMPAKPMVRNYFADPMLADEQIPAIQTPQRSPNALAKTRKIHVGAWIGSTDNRRP